MKCARIIPAIRDLRKNGIISLKFLRKRFNVILLLINVTVGDGGDGFIIFRRLKKI